MFLNCARKFWMVFAWGGRYDKMQYGFRPGKGTVDAVFFLWETLWKIRSQFFIFVYLEKAFDWVPRKCVCFSLRLKGVAEYLVNKVMSLDKGCKTAVSIDGELSSSFSVFILCESWCLSRVCFESTFIYHGNGCSDRRCEGWFINGVVVCKRSCFVWGIIKWGFGQVWVMENATEGKGLSVNVDKTQGMQLLFGKESSVLKVDLYDVCWACWV